MNRNTWRWVNTAAFVLAAAVSVFADWLPLGAGTTLSIFAAYPNAFMPASVTFAILGAIFLLLAVFTVYQWGVFDRERDSSRVLSAVGPWFAIGCAADITWIFLWHFGVIGLSLLCMPVLLSVLTVIRIRLSRLQLGLWSRFAAGIGFDVWLGWSIAMTFAGLHVWLTKIGWSGLGLAPDTWVVFSIILGAAVTSILVIAWDMHAAAFAVMWAYAGILIRQISGDGFYGGRPFVISAAIAAEAMILGAMLSPLMAGTIARRMARAQG